MEEYVEKEEEIVQVVQTKTRRSEERAEVKREPKQPVEESRKRKRGDEETRAKSSGEKVSDRVSDMAFIAWRDKLQHRDFIGERGFNEWISPFQELVKSKGWHLFCEHKAPGFVDVVIEFYANMASMKDKAVHVKGKWISFGKEPID